MFGLIVQEMCGEMQLRSHSERHILFESSPILFEAARSEVESNILLVYASSSTFSQGLAD
jgi:hypothetical protein